MLGVKRLQPPHRLASDAERLAAGCQNAKVRTDPEQRGAEFGACIEDVLTVIQKKQHVAIGQVPPQHSSRCGLWRATNAENTRSLSRDVFFSAHRTKINPPKPIRSPPPPLTP